MKYGKTIVIEIQFSILKLPINNAFNWVFGGCNAIKNCTRLKPSVKLFVTELFQLRKKQQLYYA